MTVIPTSAVSQIAQIKADRDVHEDIENAGRLAKWQARYPWDVVEVPAATEPAQWPCQRVSLHVTVIPASVMLEKIRSHK